MEESVQVLAEAEKIGRLAKGLVSSVRRIGVAIEGAASAVQAEISKLEGLVARAREDQRKENVTP